MSFKSPIQSEYPISSIGSSTRFISGYAFKSGDFCNKGRPVIKIKNIQDGLVSTTDVQCVPDELITEKLAKFLLKNGDVLIAMTGQGSVGRVGRLRCAKDVQPVMNQRVGKFVADNIFLHQDFLYYVISSEIYEKFFFSLASGSGQPNLSPDAILSVGIPYPPYQVQVEIAETFNALDDRISVLYETNTTLEAIAEALFKSWFVDFDPVHAKAEGLEPEGMDADTSALFPDSFEESELGLVPNGWAIERIADVAEIIKGKSYKSTELAESYHTALVTLKSFSRGGGFRLDGFKPYTGSYKPAQVVVPGDLIIAYTDVTQAAELIGKPAIVVGVEDYQTLVASLDVGIVKPNSLRVSRQYLYGLFRTDLFQSHTFAHTSGTTVLHLAKNGVGSYQFACPPQELVRLFSEVTDALSKRCQNNIDQIRTLTQLRDTLLPRLISGQLRLPEAEAQIEAACA